MRHVEVLIGYSWSVAAEANQIKHLMNKDMNHGGFAPFLRGVGSSWQSRTGSSFFPLLLQSPPLSISFNFNTVNSITTILRLSLFGVFVVFSPSLRESTEEVSI